MRKKEPERTLFLAVTESIHDHVMTREIARDPREFLGLPLIVFHPGEERIVRWIR